MKITGKMPELHPSAVQDEFGKTAAVRHSRLQAPLPQIRLHGTPILQPINFFFINYHHSFNYFTYLLSLIHQWIQLIRYSVQ